MEEDDENDQGSSTKEEQSPKVGRRGGPKWTKEEWDAWEKERKEKT